MQNTQKVWFIVEQKEDRGWPVSVHFSIEEAQEFAKEKGWTSDTHAIWQSNVKKTITSNTPNKSTGNDDKQEQP